MSDFEFNSSESETDNSDVDLQEALAHGVLKPGLNKIESKRQFPNDTKGLLQKQKEMSLDLPWLETLDCVNLPAPIAPEMQVRVTEHEEKRQNQLKNNRKLPQYDPSEDPIINEFKRELIFQRQAQGAVLQCFPRLHAFGIPTKRPEDYFAEMVKTDEHMQKIRERLLKEQAGKQQSERVKQLRMQRKEGKALQTQAKIERQKEKKDMLNQVKKVRKGLTNDTSFLEGGKRKGALEKRNMKNKKFGFGGKKRGLKENSKESSANMDDYYRGKSGKGKKTGKGKVVNKRPGKNRRMRNKVKGKK
ncbi:probable rRNA-processing protein EBP2 homolog [Onthophagus taurus]|uniref:probable rRNA-processing protein EBP2 homolog n=1 Tax=Onthophagus taurus TaxID=166361 RepID=UPI000C202847|nr:probable rRNA-processing protein EBP2 homolog [Onthophagus taurus]